MMAFVQGLVVTLREGIEAALLVALILAALDRAGRQSLRGAVYAGVAAATAASLAGAALFQRLKISQEAFEGCVYVGAAAMVGSMLVWMHRHARELRGRIGEQVDRVGGTARAVWLGLFLFAFLTILREGVETVLFLGVLSFSSEGVWTLVGGLAGIIVAVGFAIFFIRGSLRVDLKRFFRVTTVVLALFVVQLVINGVHELSEARILPGGPLEMALIGPIVRQNTIQLVALLLIPILMLLIPSSPPRALEEAASRAERRKQRAQEARARRGRILAAASGAVVALLLSVDTLVWSRPKELSPAIPRQFSGDTMRIDSGSLKEGRLKRYVVPAAGKQVRFLLLKQRTGKISCALDACALCGDKGYTQEGESVICRHCAAEINVPSIGEPGGCNPIPLRSHLEGSTLVIARRDLEAGAASFH